jgi:hypothetical protein
VAMAHRQQIMTVHCNKDSQRLHNPQGSLTTFQAPLQHWLCSTMK